MGSTIIEKILGRAAGREPFRVGDVAVCKPDMVVQTELGWARGWHRPKKLFDTSKIVVIIDHAVPAPSIRDAAGNTEGRRFAQEFGLKMYDVGRHGIGNFFAGEIGLIRPGEVLVGSDSHLCTVGAFNCAGRGVGPLDLLQGMTKGLVWYVVNPTIRYEFKGKMAPLVSGKDVFFHIAQEYGAHTNLNLEFGGPGLAAIQMSDRRTMATMCAELGAEFATFEFDAITEKFFEGRVTDKLTPVAPDADAEYPRSPRHRSQRRRTLCDPAAFGAEERRADVGLRQEDQDRSGIHRFLRQWPDRRFPCRGQDPCRTEDRAERAADRDTGIAGRLLAGCA